MTKSPGILAAAAAAVAAALATPSAQAGFKYKMDDVEGKIGGRLIVNFSYFTESNPRTDSHYVRSARVGTEGTFHKVFGYKVYGEFSGTSASLADGFMSWQIHDSAKIQFGRFKHPVGWETLRSTQEITFPERSAIDRLAPGRDTGAMLSGKVLDGGANYAVSLGNGTSSNASTDDNDGKDVAGRIGVKPFVLAGLDPRDWGDLEVALAAQVGNQDVTASDVTSPATGTTIVDFQSATRVHGKRERHNLQATWAGGPASVAAEWLRQSATYERPSPVRRQSAQIAAGYLTGTFFLTGEKAAPGKLPKVLDPVTKGGKGAWEVAVRYGFFDPSQNLYKNNNDFALSPSSVSQMQEWFVGVNFYPEDPVRFSLAWMMNDFGKSKQTGVAGKELSDESAVLGRAQIVF